MLKAAREQKTKVTADQANQREGDWRSREIAQTLTEKVYEDKFGPAPTKTEAEKQAELEAAAKGEQVIDTTANSEDEAPALEEVDMDEYRRQEQLKKLTEEFNVDAQADNKEVPSKEEEEEDAEAELNRATEELNRATEMEMEKARKQKEWFDKVTA